MAIVLVEAIYEGGTYELQRDNQAGVYYAEIQALKKEIRTDEKYSYYPVMLRVTDDSGNVTVRTILDAQIGDDLLLVVREEQVFPLKFIVANARGEELGYIKDADRIDIDLGETNDFELQLSSDAWTEEFYNWRYRIYIPNTEYGGLLEERRTSTGENTVTWAGYTWRGLLSQKIIQPPSGQSHMTVSGDANEIIKTILGGRFGALFVADSEKSGINVKNFKFDRYCTILNGLEKMLQQYGARLKLYYKQGTPGGMDGAVHVCAVPVTDWSGQLEYSQDGRIDFTTKDYRKGINHLICAGEGEGESREILHLYVQKDGTIGEKRYYTGLDERESLYSYTSVEDTEQLKKEGVERLQELMNYTEMVPFVSNADIDLGDVVGGRDRLTGMSIQQPVVNKILRTQDGKTEIEYKLKGEE